MYQPFKITTVSSDFKNKRIVAHANHDIAEESINDSTVQVFEKSSRTFLELNFKIDGKILFIEFYDWPVPNEEYVLKINTIQNILEEDSEDTIRRQIIFKSEIRNTIRITSPSNFEQVDSIIVEWEEINHSEEEDYNDRYYIEISDDNAFYNIVKKTEIFNKKTLSINNLPISQYYIRCRAQNDDFYGKWSDIVTFNMSKDPAKDDDIYEDDSMEPIIEKDLDIIRMPINGETPKSIIIKFDELIDSESIRNIKVNRRDI